MRSAGLASWLLNRRAADRSQAEGHVGSASRLSRLLDRALQRCTARNERLHVCESVSLGGRRSLVLVECDGRRFLAGLSADGVQSLIAVDGSHAPAGSER